MQIVLKRLFEKDVLSLTHLLNDNLKTEQQEKHMNGEREKKLTSVQTRLKIY